MQCATVCKLQWLHRHSSMLNKQQANDNAHNQLQIKKSKGHGWEDMTTDSQVVSSTQVLQEALGDVGTGVIGAG